jgi:hypothetical protein
MKKPALITLIAFACAIDSARAQLIVEDVVHIAQDAVNQVVDLAKYAEMVSNQVKQITTMTQELQQTVAYVKAFGDPSKLLNITGANELVSGLQQSGVGQSLGSLRQSASGISSLQNNASGLYQPITNTSLSGTQVSRATDIYKPFGAVENASSNYTAVYDDAMQRRKALKSQMAQTIDQLQSATTDAETQKLQALLTGQSAQLQAIDHEIAGAASQAVVQDLTNRNDGQKQQKAQNEEVASDRHDAFTKFGAMMVPDVNSDLRFGKGNGQ